jgi:hypothetical protein
MHKNWTTILMQLKLAQDGNIMVRTWMPKIQVNEQALIINNHDDVVH